MNLGLLVIGLIIFGIEPIVIGTLRGKCSPNAILVGMGIFNSLLFLGYGLWFQSLSRSISKGTAKDKSKQIGRRTASYLFFPAFVLLTLTVDFYFGYAPNNYGVIAMLAGALIFFSVLVVGYGDIHQHGVYRGDRKIMPKDYVLWVSLMVASVVRFLLGDLWIHIRLTLALWVLVLSMILAIRGMKLIKGSVRKVSTIKIGTAVATVLTAFSIVYTYVLIVDNKAHQETINQYISGYVKGLFSSNGALTGVALSGANDEEALMTGQLLSGVVASGAVDVEETVEEVVDETDLLVDSLPEGNLPYSEIIPYLVAKYELKPISSKQNNFVYVRKTNPIYDAFNITAQRRMIGTKINPAYSVSCDTYIVLKGIAAGWNVNYTGTPFDAFWDKAAQLGALNGCEHEAFVKKENL